MLELMNMQQNKKNKKGEEQKEILQMRPSEVRDIIRFVKEIDKNVEFQSEMVKSLQTKFNFAITKGAA